MLLEYAQNRLDSEVASRSVHVEDLPRQNSNKNSVRNLQKGLHLEFSRRAAPRLQLEVLPGQGVDQ